MPRKKKTPAPSPADAYFAPNPDTKWVTDFMAKYNGFNPVGFKRLIDSGKFLVAPKESGGLVPFKPNRQQSELIDRIIANRKVDKPTRIILIKPRQGMGASTGMAAIFSGEAFANRAANSTVSANQPETIDAIWDCYRLMFASMQGQIVDGGGFKESFEKKRGARDNRRQLRVPETISSINIANASTKRGTNLGRGTAPKSWHASEGDFYPDLESAMASIMPALPKTAISTAVIETTPNLKASTYFKEFVLRNVERRANPKADHEGLWDIWFVPWYQVDYFRRPVSVDMGQLTDAERALLAMGATHENLAWRRYDLNESFGGDEKRFTEAYPATLEEALTAWGVSRFFFPEAEEFYRKNTICEPASYQLMDSQARDPMRELEPRDLDFYPQHVRIWSPPVSGHTYHIPADCADSEGRKTEIGSHNAAVVLDSETGEQMAEIDASCPTYVFTFALEQLGKYYNIAELAPEDNADGSSVRMVLNSIRNYPNLYQMEDNQGALLGQSEKFGFKTNAKTRREMIDALRFAFNTRRLVIRSERALKQILDRGRANFEKLGTHDKEAGKFDDLAICFAIGCLIHGNAYKWRPKTAEQVAAEKLSAKPQEHKIKKKVEKRRGICYDVSALEDEESEADRRLRRELNRT